TRVPVWRSRDIITSQRLPLFPASVNRPKTLLRLKFRRATRRSFVPPSLSVPIGASVCRTAGQLTLAAPALDAGRTCGEVFNWLLANPDVPAVAILDEHGSVVGLVNRLIYLARYARQYAPELYSKKPILTLANNHPLIVDENVPVVDLGATLLVE